MGREGNGAGLWPRKDDGAEERRPRSLAQKEFRRGLKLAREGRLDRAVTSFQEALALRPELSQAHYELGLAYQTKGELAQALEAYELELALNPQDDAALNNMGVIHAGCGNLEEAICLFRRALEANPRNALARENLRKAEREKVAGPNRVLKFDSSPLEGPRPSISLCMIVKDEERNLPDCLASLKDLASEMVIVDTGSRDRTVQIAESFGAKVYHFPWRNDFSLARNESLRHATGDWILAVDADFRIAPDAAAKLERAAASGEAGAYFISTRSPLPAEQLGQQELTLLPLLFRNLPGIEFRGAVHEEVIYSLREAGIQPARTDIVVEHLGYANPKARREKAARNLEMLKHRLEEAPEDPLLLFYIAQCYSVLGQGEEAIGWLRKVISSPLAEPTTRANAYISLMGVLLKAQEHGEALATAGEARRLFPGHRFLCFISGLARRDAGDYPGALEEFRAARKLEVEMGRHSLLLEVSAEAIEREMADCHLSLAQGHIERGAPMEAVRVLREALAECGEEAALLNALGGAYLALRKVPEAIAWFRRALELKPDSRQVRRNLAVALKREGLVSEALAVGLPLLDGEPEGKELRLLAGLHLAAGEGEEAMALYERLASSGEDRAPDHIKLARLRADKGNMEETIEGLLDALELWPGEATLWQELGRIYLRAGLPELAEEALARAQELEPSSPAVSVRLGRLLLAQGAIERAIPYLEWAVELAPTSPESLKALAAAYHRAGRSDEAVLLWRHAQALVASPTP